MKLKALVKILDEIFKKDIATLNDPIGLSIGNLEREINSAIITLDITDEVISEAIEKKIDLIISHHPLIFKPFLKIVDDNLKSNSVLKLIENKIAVYSAHTNLDSMIDGLNDLVAKKIGLSNLKVLEFADLTWYKFVVFVPVDYENKIRQVICENGGGLYKNYSCCTFNILGTGTFKPLDGANPFIGSIGNLEFVKEVRIECVVSKINLEKLISAVLKAHPYEEPAYDVYRLENSLTNEGLGRYGVLDPAVTLDEFLQKLKRSLNLKNLRLLFLDENKDRIYKRKIKNVAIINGSANSFTDRFDLRKYEFDAVLVGELKYHNALEIAQSGKIFIEIGHGESEFLAVDLMYDMIQDVIKKVDKKDKNKVNSNNMNINNKNVIKKDNKDIITGTDSDFLSLKNLKLYKAKRCFIGWRYYIE